MNLLDSTTLFVVGGLVLVLAGVSFLLETMLRRNDVVGRLWSVFYVSAMFAVFVYLVANADPANWWAIAAGNGAYVTAIGFVWCGARRANRRDSLVVVPILLGGVVTVAALLAGEQGGYWAGSLEMFIGVAVMSALAAFEFCRGDLVRLLASRVLAALSGGVALYYLGRAVAFAAVGPEHPIFQQAFGTAASTLVEICFVVIGTLMLSSVQGDRFARLNDDDVELGTRVRIDGILNAHLFREVAETWLLRAIRERKSLALLLIDVADLRAINSAFGRAAGDAAIRTTGRIVLTQAPAAAIIGHLRARQFALLLELPTNGSVESVADRIGEAVLGAVLDDRDRFRASTFRGIATTHSSGARYSELLLAAEHSVSVDAERALDSQREGADAKPEAKLTKN